MIEAKVPKDIRKFKGKTIGPFSLRQTICVIVAAVFATAAYIIMKPYDLTSDTKMFIMFLCAMIPLIFSVEKSGMPMEVYIKEVVYRNIVFPPKRVAKTDIEVHAPKKDAANMKKINDEYKQYMKLHPEMKMYK